MTRATVIINLRQRETSLLKHIYKTAFLLFLLFVYFCLLLFVLFVLFCFIGFFWSVQLNFRLNHLFHTSFRVCICTYCVKAQSHLLSIYVSVTL